MDRTKQRNIIITAIVLTAATVIILITAGFAARDREYTPSGWVLKAYGNSIALYNGEELAEVYGDIVLDNLPPEDVKILENGIAFPTREEAERAVEDYDG
ncbi:MAG: hypothetical protein ACI4F7_02280 [Acutalibacteraceae bacterium]